MIANQPAPSLQHALQDAKRLQSQGRLSAAKQLYEDILRRMPGQPDALTLLASIAYQLGREQDGDALLDAAIESYAVILAHGQSGDAVRAARVNLLLARGRQAEAEREIAVPKLPINPVRAAPDSFARRLAEAKAQG
ncbi:MAG: tetratricopeptide repeat protein, partial [Firmicutes bacterium]|nr:tetratricopeptide repeat protein [Bacillota bacterium]